MGNVVLVKLLINYWQELLLNSNVSGSEVFLLKMEIFKFLDEEMVVRVKGFFPYALFPLSFGE